MEVLVVVAIVVVLLAIAIPTYSHFITKGYQSTAVANMRSLGVAFGTYAAQNDGRFPMEDASGPNTWSAATKPENQKVWYNALPHILGQRTAGDFASDPRAFYTKTNVLFFPGAKYPDGDRRIERPLFAVAMNSRLQRKDEFGNKSDRRLAQAQRPSSTVLFFEQGLRGEKKSYGAQGAYDGAPKGTARSFVGRYNGIGVVCFLDGHTELYRVHDMLTETGALPFPQTEIVWTLDPEADPN